VTARPIRSPDHYSYTVYADPAMARTFDERRFGGPVGRLVAEDQARVLHEALGPLDACTLLDVGTGTGRAALLLAHAGARVTGLDASDEMLSVARRRAAEEGLDVRFVAGDAHAIDFPDRSFDTVVSLRVLMHAPRWRTCLRELCRVADRRVVFDYPSLGSAAALESIARRFLYRVGGRTEPYRVFGARSIERELAAHGFRPRIVHPHFTLPIAFHKAIGSPRFTQRTEAIFERIGLKRLLGSPVTIVAERCAPS
jgi:SAM-dependent methyltransferase